jgi:hypothetical protein
MFVQLLPREQRAAVSPAPVACIVELAADGTAGTGSYMRVRDATTGGAARGAAACSPLALAGPAGREGWNGLASPDPTQAIPFGRPISCLPFPRGPKPDSSDYRRFGSDEASHVSRS